MTGLDILLNNAIHINLMGGYDDIGQHGTLPWRSEKQGVKIGLFGFSPVVLLQS